MAGTKTSDGLVLLASSEDVSQRSDFFNDKTEEFEYLSEKSVFFSKCGHWGAKSFRRNLWGNEAELEIRGELIRKTGILRRKEVCDTITCPACDFEAEKSRAIRCCACGRAILRNDPVATYHISSPFINMQVAKLVGNSAIACTFSDCCPSLGAFAGHWTSDGFKPLSVYDFD